MDLEPINPSLDAPVYEDGSHRWGHYNWDRWRWLWSFLEPHMDLSEFSGYNDGDEISDATCKQVANVIREQAPKLEDEEDRAWILEHAKLWETCGGYRQY